MINYEKPTTASRDRKAFYSDIGLSGVDSAIAHALTPEPDRLIEHLLELPAERFSDELGSKLRTLSTAARRILLDRLGAELDRREPRLDARLQQVRLAIAVLKDVNDWLHNGAIHIERAQSSRAHDLVAAIRAGDRCVVYEVGKHLPETGLQFVNTFAHGQDAGHIFIVEHDWASAFAGAQDYEEEAKFRLPYDRCTFEFCVRGRRVLVNAITTGDDFVMAMHCELRESIRHGWFAVDMTDEAFADLSEAMVRQVRAICVSLEAEITYADAIRIPEKLRKARERDGKLPPFDHHIVRLHRCQRAARYEGEHEPGPRKRLHFRRGHWRHYASHRTWIKWTLVGNPDLGFVDKEYRL